MKNTTHNTVHTLLQYLLDEQDLLLKALGVNEVSM